MNCNQCNRPSIVQVGGHNLCVEHFSMFQTAQSRHQNDLFKMMNYLQDDIDMSIGLGRLGPRFPIEQPIIRTGNTIVNKLNIDRSTIGVLNTGTVGKLESSITLIQESDKQLAESIKFLTEAVSKNSELNQEARKEIIEQLSFISNQICLPKNERNPSVTNITKKTLAATISTSADLLTIWQVLEPMLRKYLGF